MVFPHFNLYRFSPAADSQSIPDIRKREGGKHFCSLLSFFLGRTRLNYLPSSLSPFSPESNNHFHFPWIPPPPFPKKAILKDSPFLLSFCQNQQEKREIPFSLSPLLPNLEMGARKGGGSRRRERILFL